MSDFFCGEGKIGSVKTSTVATPAQQCEQFLALAAQAYDELERWYDQHPDATFAEIEAKAREVQQALMGRGLEILIYQRRHTADITPVEQVHAVASPDAAASETTPCRIEPVKEQGNVSPDGVFIRIRGEGWKEVKITAISQVKVSRRQAEQVSARHPAHEPVVKLERHSYQATLGGADDVARQRYVKGLRRGLPDCARVTSVNDGAAWIERITRANFPDAVQIVDWAHAAQRVHRAAERAWPQQADTAKAWAETQLDALWAGGTQAVAEAIRGLPQAEAAELAGYFANNAERMRYAEFRAQGLPIGSGVVESGCKTVIQRRLKGPCRGWGRLGMPRLCSPPCVNCTATG